MPPRCTICDHPDIDEINEALAADKVSMRVLAGEYDLKTSSLQRHRANHLPIALTEAVRERRLRAGSEVLDVALVDQEERLKRQSDRWERLHRVIDQRAVAMADVAEGGDTGLLVRKVKSIGSGEYTERVDEYAVDAPMLKEIRELEKQTSEELGQSKEKGSTGSGAVPAVVIIQPKLILPPGITADLPSVNPVRFPDGAPAGYLEAPPIDDEQEIVDVIDDVVEQAPNLGPLKPEVEGDGNVVFGRGMASKPLSKVAKPLSKQPNPEPLDEEIEQRLRGIDTDEDEDYF